MRTHEKVKALPTTTKTTTNIKNTIEQEIIKKETATTKNNKHDKRKLE